MAFRFNFRREDESDPQRDSNERIFALSETCSREREHVSFYTAGPDVLQLPRPDNDVVVVNVTDDHYKVISDVSSSIKKLQIQGHVIKFLSSADIKGKLDESETTKRLSAALEHHSDLIPDVYEGGLKVWECAKDLAQYLSENAVITNGLRVLELGCGAGLPGIVSLKYGAKVDFQDFNYEVLNLITIPNVLLNMEDSSVATESMFMAGDWALIDKFISEHKCTEDTKYDVILASETIYNPKNQRKLLNLMKSALKSKGVIYLAAKTYYFGVGGGTRQFEDLVKEDGMFTIYQCKTFSQGVQREILQMKCKNAT